MSLGSTYNNNQNYNKSNFPDVTVYSYRMNNAESQIDSTCITTRFWKNNLCIGIYPRKNTGNDEVTFDMDNGITIYLSPVKALMLKNEIEKFMQDPVKYNQCGVPSGSAVITISNGVEYGKNVPVLTIRKVDDAGNIVASFAYEFKNDYHFSIHNYDGKNFDRNYDDYRDIEIRQLLMVLDEYTKASTNAVAFTVMEQRKYSATRTDNKIDSICAALGIDNKQAGGNQRKYNNTSYFNNSSNGNDSHSNYPSSNSVSYGSATIDDLE